MHNLVESLKNMTENMVEQLDRITEEQIISFIDQREQIVRQLQRMDITEADRKKYGDIVRGALEYDTVITAKLEQLRVEAGQGIQKVNLAKAQNNAYNTTYIPDSYYFDKKK